MNPLYSSGKRQPKDKWRKILPRFGVKMRLNSFSFITYVNFEISWFDTRPDFLLQECWMCIPTGFKRFDFKLNLKWDIFISFEWPRWCLFLLDIFHLVDNFRTRLRLKIEADILN